MTHRALGREDEGRNFIDDQSTIRDYPLRATPVCARERERARVRVHVRVPRRSLISVGVRRDSLPAHIGVCTCVRPDCCRCVQLTGPTMRSGAPGRSVYRIKCFRAPPRHSTLTWGFPLIRPSPVIIGFPRSLIPTDVNAVRFVI